MGSSTWIFVARPLPFSIEGDPSTVMVWMSGEHVVDMSVLPTAALTEQAIAESYARALEADGADDAPRGPRRIVVESGPTAKRLRAIARGARIEIGSTRAVEPVLEELFRELLLEQEAELDRDAFFATPEAWKPVLLGLGTRLAEAAPWELLPFAPALEVHAPSLGIEDGRIVVMGDTGETYGFLFFEDEAQRRRFEDFAGGVVRADDAADLRCVGVDLRQVRLEPSDGEAHELAIVSVLHGEARRLANDEERRLAVALAETLLALVADHREALAAGDDRDAPLPTLRARYVVEVLGESVEVALAVPGDED
jgi:hypothetical protein